MHTKQMICNLGLVAGLLAISACEFVVSDPSIQSGNCGGEDGHRGKETPIGRDVGPSRVEKSGALDLIVSTNLHGNKVILAKLLSSQRSCSGTDVYRAEVLVDRSPNAPAVLIVEHEFYDEAAGVEKPCAVEVYAAPVWQEVYTTYGQPLSFTTLEFQLIGKQGELDDCKINLTTLVSTCQTSQ